MTFTLVWKSTLHEAQCAVPLKKKKKKAGWKFRDKGREMSRLKPQTVNAICKSWWSSLHAFKQDPLGNSDGGLGLLRNKKKMPTFSSKLTIGNSSSLYRIIAFIGGQKKQHIINYLWFVSDLRIEPWPFGQIWHRSAFSYWPDNLFSTFLQKQGGESQICFQGKIRQPFRLTQVS